MGGLATLLIINLIITFGEVHALKHQVSESRKDLNTVLGIVVTERNNLSIIFSILIDKNVINSNEVMTAISKRYNITKGTNGIRK